MQITKRTKDSRSADSASGGMEERMAKEIRNNQILDRFGNKHWMKQECEGCCSIFYDANFERCPICNTVLVSFVELEPRSANDPTSQTPEETAFWQKAEDEL